MFENSVDDEENVQNVNSNAIASSSPNFVPFLPTAQALIFPQFFPIQPMISQQAQMGMQLQSHSFMPPSTQMSSSLAVLQFQHHPSNIAMPPTFPFLSAQAGTAQYPPWMLQGLPFFRNMSQWGFFYFLLFTYLFCCDKVLSLQIKSKKFMV